MSFCEIHGDAHIYQWNGWQHVCECGKIAVFDDYDRTWSEK